jgi:hypothetical protein
MDLASVHAKIIENYNVYSTNSIKIDPRLLGDMALYNARVLPILVKYQNELKKPTFRDFITGDIINDTGEKKKLITEFQNLVDEYSSRWPSIFFTNELSMTVMPTIVEETICRACNEKSVIEIKEYEHECTHCGCIREVAQAMFSYTDSTRINRTSKYTYERRMHFRDFMNQYQGKQQNSIPDEVYKYVESKIKTHNLLKPGKSRIEQYDRVTKSHIEIFLKEFKYAKPVEDLNIVYSVVTGKKLDDISHLEAALLQDFDTLNALYEKTFVKTKRVDRKSFLHTQYILFQLLRKHKHPCDENDFNLLKTPDRKQFHDNICSQLFAELGWNFVHVF